MNKKWLYIGIISFTLVLILIILLIKPRSRYDKYIISSNKWNDIISNKNSGNIKLDSIKFNDYNLLIDEDNSNIYYSIVDSNSKYNPLVSYKNNKYKIAFNNKLTEEGSIQVLVYNDKSYHIYNLIITDMPILNITYKEDKINKRKIPVDIYLFDNDVETSNKVLKSKGDLSIIKENSEYILALITESLGRNRRENDISIFGMDKHNEYVLKVSETSDKYINLFINNKYVGKCSLKHLERNINNEPRKKR